MKRCVPRSMPLAQAITGVPGASSGAIAPRGCAQMLRRHRQQDGVVAPDRGAESGAMPMRSSSRSPGSRGLSRRLTM